MFPQNQNVLLQRDSPLVLAFMVCGDSQGFADLRYRIKISRGATAQEMLPPVNSSLVLDSNTVDGIAVTVWSVESTVYEKCVEIPIRVDAEYPGIADSSVELLFTRGFASSPLGTYIYHLLEPPAVETEEETPAVETEEETPAAVSTTTTTTPGESLTTSDTIPAGATGGGGGGDTDAAESNSEGTTEGTTEDTEASLAPQTIASTAHVDNNKPSTVDTSILSTSPQSPSSGETVIYIIAGLGGALLTAVVVIVVLVLCVIRRRRINMMAQVDLESSKGSKYSESKGMAEDTIMVALHWNKTSSACKLS